jgi:hypothetical protein
VVTSAKAARTAKSPVFIIQKYAPFSEVRQQSQSTLPRDSQTAHFFCRLSDRQKSGYGMPFPANSTEKDNVGSNKRSDKKWGTPKFEPPRPGSLKFRSVRYKPCAWLG